MGKLKSFVKRNKLIYILLLKIRELYNKLFISDIKCIRNNFKKRLGRDVKLNNPIKFNDKLQWLKLNWYDPLAVKCADKYAVRNFVKEKIGEKYLNEIYGVYKNVENINIDKLPNSFVLKPTHSSGFNIICEDKNRINWDKQFRQMKGWLSINLHWLTREWVYKNIEPQIICEKYLSENGSPPKDYKIFYFNGEPKLIEVDFDRFSSHKRNLYDVNWNFIDAEIEYPNDPNTNISKPKKLDKMIELGEILAEDFPHVRVDFYNCNGKIIFGELTFFHESGMGKFSPEEFELEMGKWLELPRNNKG